MGLMARWWRSDVKSAPIILDTQLYLFRAVFQFNGDFPGLGVLEAVGDRFLAHAQQMVLDLGRQRSHVSRGVELDRHRLVRHHLPSRIRERGRQVAFLQGGRAEVQDRSPRLGQISRGDDIVPLVRVLTPSPGTPGEGWGEGCVA